MRTSLSPVQVGSEGACGHVVLLQLRGSGVAASAMHRGGVDPLTSTAMTGGTMNTPLSSSRDTNHWDENAISFAGVVAGRGRRWVRRKRGAGGWSQEDLRHLLLGMYVRETHCPLPPRLITLHIKRTSLQVYQSVFRLGLGPSELLLSCCGLRSSRPCSAHNLARFVSLYLL